MDMPVVLLLSLPLTRDDVELKVLIAQRGESARNEAFRSAGESAQSMANKMGDWLRKAGETKNDNKN